ncbi:MAG: hypothetical protein ACLT8C_02740 [Akkermansia muciniphila]
MERQIILGAIDKMCRNTCTTWTPCGKACALRAQGQKDPLVEYKSEAYDLFITLMESIKSEAISNLFKSTSNLTPLRTSWPAYPSLNLPTKIRKAEPACRKSALTACLRTCSPP